MKPSGMKGLWVVCALLAGCGGAGVDESPATESPTRAMGGVYDPSIHCLVDFERVRCASGVYAYSQWNDEVGYFIERNACQGRPAILCQVE
ncbi:hypothetical protein LZ198_40250 [Myxococcus sp. K15C18031901]|uniref:hypothetical protein n=1 Tax=Myxococcus dinghuensis TaxID=2906761 RepID=UPI0020A7D818|nr:hypothetical protein [Myxococcus dinghuensis]MCP3105118.1 hypothetical protein [Myxococcus dinghuensis]